MGFVPSILSYVKAFILSEPIKGHFLRTYPERTLPMKRPLFWCLASSTGYPHCRNSSCFIKVGAFQTNEMKDEENFSKVMQAKCIKSPHLIF